MGAAKVARRGMAGAGCDGFYEDARTSVRFGGNTSDSFEVKVGLHQGSVLSPLLFVIVMNATSSGVTSGLLHVYEILYADDLALIAENEAELEEKLNHGTGA